MAEKLITLKSVRRVVRLGEHGPVLLHRSKSKKRKHSWFFKPVEKSTRRVARAYRDGSDEYLERHDRSSRKRKNGWVRDYPRNAQKAMRKGFKRMKLPGF